METTVNTVRFFLAVRYFDDKNIAIIESLPQVQNEIANIEKYKQILYRFLHNLSGIELFICGKECIDNYCNLINTKAYYDMYFVNNHIELFLLYNIFNHIENDTFSFRNKYQFNFYIDYSDMTIWHESEISKITDSMIPFFDLTADRINNSAIASKNKHKFTFWLSNISIVWIYPKNAKELQIFLQQIK